MFSLHEHIVYPYGGGGGGGCGGGVKFISMHLFQKVMAQRNRKVILFLVNVYRNRLASLRFNELD